MPLLLIRAADRLGLDLRRARPGPIPRPRPTDLVVTVCDKAHEALGAPEADYRIEAAIAIGRPTEASVLPESYRAREVPSGREPVGSFVFEGRLGVP